jgi:hypothetical protein
MRRFVPNLWHPAGGFCCLFLLVARSAAAQVAVDGVVYDSISRGVLAGATVQFFGPTDGANPRVAAATTDARGEFRITGLPRGRYLAGFFHASLDSLGLDMPPQVVDLNSDRHTRLTTPSPVSLSRLFCAGKPTTDSTAILIGHLRESGSGRGVVNAQVHVDWSETTVNQKKISAVDVIATSETTGPGWFAVCGVPASTPVIVRAEQAGDTTGDVRVELPPSGLGHVTLHLAISPDSAARSPRRAGTARVAGTVLDWAGRPAIADVSAWGTSVSATTDERGQFRLDRLPAGTRTIEVRAIGAQPVLVVADLLRDQTNRIDARLERVVALKAVEIRATVAYSKNLEIFERHQRRSAGGAFIRALDGAQAGQDLIGLARTAMGVDVAFGRDHRWHVSMKKPGASLRPKSRLSQGGPGAALDAGTCTPTIYLDGIKTSDDFDDLVAYLGFDLILAVEVYPHYGEIPSDYPVDPLSACGLISIWTRPLESRPKKP